MMVRPASREPGSPEMRTRTWVTLPREPVRPRMEMIWPSLAWSPCWTTTSSTSTFLPLAGLDMLFLLVD